MPRVSESQTKAKANKFAGLKYSHNHKIVAQPVVDAAIVSRKAYFFRKMLILADKKQVVRDLSVSNVMCTHGCFKKSARLSTER